MVVAAWDLYQSVEVVADNEADAVLSMARLAQVLAEEDETRFVVAPRAYGRNVIDVEWPAMQHGDFASMRHSPLGHQIWQTELAASTRQDAVDAVSADLPRQLDSLSDSRRARVSLSNSGLPIIRRVTSIIGAVITVGFSYLFAVDDGRVQGVSDIKPTAMEFGLQEIDAISSERSAQP